MKWIHTNGKRLNVENKRRDLVANKKNSRRAIKQKGLKSGGSYSIIRAWFRSRDLWVMGPPRFRCATLIVEYILYQSISNVTFRQSSVPIFIYLLRLCLSFPSLHQHHKKIVRKTIQNFDQNPQKISIKEAFFNNNKKKKKGMRRRPGII